MKRFDYKSNYQMSEMHFERFIELLVRYKGEANRDQKALLFILAGVGELYDHADEIFDFNESCIKPRCTTKLGYMPQSFKMLIRLGFNLYGGRPKVSVNDVFWPLDDQNTKLALEAIRIAFAR